MQRSIYLVTLVSAVLLTSPVAQGQDSIRHPVSAEFTTSDGVQIVGDFWTPALAKEKAPVVILLHMNRQTRHTYKPLIPTLKNAGFAVLAIDMRGHGESIKPESKNLQESVRQRDAGLYNAMYKDVEAAYNWLAGREEVDLSRFALVGASVGCSVVLDYASRDMSVDVTVLMTPGKNYMGVDSVRHIGRYGTRPILLLCSEEERSKGTDFLSAKVAHAEVKIYPQTEIHGTNMFGRVESVEKEISEYLKMHVGRASNEMVYASVNSKVYHPAGSPTIQRIKKENLRVFSSSSEAERRGLRATKIKGGEEGSTDDPTKRDSAKTDRPDDF